LGGIEKLPQQRIDPTCCFCTFILLRGLPYYESETDSELITPKCPNIARKPVKPSLRYAASWLVIEVSLPVLRRFRAAQIEHQHRNGWLRY
jgi:hypothetical protein